MYDPKACVCALQVDTGNNNRRPSRPVDRAVVAAAYDMRADRELAAAVTIARQTLPKDDPLLMKALRAVRSKERRRGHVNADELTLAVKPCRRAG
jgi:hypothetical protein